MALVRERHRPLVLGDQAGSEPSIRRPRLPLMSDRVDSQVFRPWLVAWLGGSVLGIVNGTIREVIYKDRVGEMTAHYLSTLILIVLLGLYLWWLEYGWPLPSVKVALQVGLTWAVMTASFDFGFGHYVDGKSWAELARDYDITAGRVWIAILAWIIVGPMVARRLHHGRES
jgi:hypothetical protein